MVVAVAADLALVAVPVPMIRGLTAVVLLVVPVVLTGTRRSQTLRWVSLTL